MYVPAAVAVSFQDQAEYRPLDRTQHFQLHWRISRHSDGGVLNDQVRSTRRNFQQLLPHGTDQLGSVLTNERRNCCLFGIVLASVCMEGCNQVEVSAKVEDHVSRGNCGGGRGEGCGGHDLGDGHIRQLHHVSP